LGRSPEEVAEVFQTVCFTMLERLNALKNETSLSSWLTTMTLQQGLRARRQQQDQSSRTDLSLSLQEVIRTLEQERLVRQAISMMEEPCRRLLTSILYEKEPRSRDEVTTELIPATSIKPNIRMLLEAIDGGAR